MFTFTLGAKCGCHGTILSSVCTKARFKLLIDIGERFLGSHLRRNKFNVFKRWIGRALTNENPCYRETTISITSVMLMMSRVSWVSFLQVNFTDLRDKNVMNHFVPYYYVSECINWEILIDIFAKVSGDSATTTFTESFNKELVLLYIYIDIISIGFFYVSEDAIACFFEKKCSAILS